jgi:hypothetical protein
MSKYTGMAFNQLRTEAKAAGFEGSNPKRADLEAFLESREPAPEVGAITPPKGAKTSVKNTTEITTDAAAAVTVSADKRKYVTVGKDAVKQRRSVILEATKEYINSKDSALTQSEIFQAVCAATGTEQTSNSWTDVTNALNHLKTTGILTVSKEDKKRAKYSRTIS